MKKVLLRFYGFNNLGDDLFIKIITERYKNPFTLIIRQPNAFIRSVANLKLFTNKLLISLYAKIEWMVGRNNLLLNFLTRSHDLVVYIGGSLFIEGADLKKWQREKRSYERLKKPYYILGSNFGPYSDPRFVPLVKSIFAKASDVCFRDGASYEQFKDLPTTRVATDIAFTLDASKYIQRSEKVAIFSIINCEDRFDKNISNKYDQEIANLASSLVKDGYKVIFMSFCEYEGDGAAIRRISSTMPKSVLKNVEVYTYDGNLEEALSLIGKSEIVIATRFHAAILGLLFSKKVLPMAYSHKTLNILHDLKFKGEVIDISKIEEFDGNEFDFTGLEVNDVSAQIEVAERQFLELDKVLTVRK